MPSPRPLRVPLVLLTLLGWVAACAGPVPVSVDATSRRALPAGEVVGYTGQYGSHVWRGLPYAAAPLGELRWRAPRPAPRWEGVREALATGTACPQFASVFSGEGRGAKGIIGDEDCLYLDVYAPRLEPDAVPSGAAKLPVMVWIHGGGNSIGRAGFYDGGNLAQHHDVVVVAINYRLGPFGWFRHASLRGGDATQVERSGNFAQLDHIRALEWVQENIAAFGGDPGNVTIFGESAGGRNVLSLVLSPLGRGLFHRAVVQSGGWGSATAEEAEHFADDPTPGHPHSSNEILASLLAEDGSTPSLEAARERAVSMGTSEAASYLRGKSHSEILTAYVGDAFSFQGMLGFPQVFRDGAVLPIEEPMERLASGDYNQVPIIFGTNRDENKLFMLMDPTQVRWRLGLIPQLLDADRYNATAEHLAKLWKARSVDVPAALMRRVQGPSVFAYRWDWDEEPGIPLLYDGGEVLGAAHGLEVAFVFGHFQMGPDSNLLFGRGSRAGRLALSGQMMSYWAEFAYTGSPGRGRGDDQPEWPAWDDSSAEAPRFIVLDTPSDGGPRMASQALSIDSAITGLLADPRLAMARDRCSVLRTVVDMGFLDRAQYADTESCRGYAYEAYPWTDVAAQP